MNISNAVIEEIRDRIYGQLVTYQNDLNEAYLAAGDDPIDVKLGVKVAPDNGKKKVTTSISFIKEKCRDTTTSWVSDSQTGLFDEVEKEG